MSKEKAAPVVAAQERQGGEIVLGSIIPPPLFYHTERGSAMFEISSYLKHGRENATSATILCSMANTTPRGLRRCIAIERAAGAEILYTPGGQGGYFLPSLDPEQAQQERLAFYNVMKARTICTFKALRPVARALGVPAGQMIFDMEAEEQSEMGAENG